VIRRDCGSRSIRSTAVVAAAVAVASREGVFSERRASPDGTRTRLPAIHTKAKRHWRASSLTGRCGARRSGAALAGSPTVLTVQATATGLDRAHIIELEARRLDAVPSIYRASVLFDDRTLQAHIDLEEDARTAGSPGASAGIGAMAIHLILDGPRTGASATLGCMQAAPSYAEGR